MTRISVLIFALALSLLFNVFFAVGYLRARAELASGAGTAPTETRLVAEELGLNEDQSAVFAELRSRIRTETAEHDAALALAEQELASELEREDPDPAKIDAIMDRKTEIHRERRLAAGRAFTEFMSVLTPEQREVVSRRIHRPHGPGMPPHLLERFDTNRDGHIDDEERAAGRAFHDQWRKERQAQRARMLEQFDTNGDGVLDPAERAAMPDRPDRPDRPPRHRPPPGRRPGP